MKKIFFLCVLIFSVFLSACAPSESEIATMTAAVWTVTYPPTNTAVPTETPIPTHTLKPTETQTPTPEFTATPTGTPTPEQPTALALLNAFCRWGPGEDYRSSGLLFREGAVAVVEGKRITGDGTWYLIRMEDADWSCWSHSTTMEVAGDASAIRLARVYVPEIGKVPPPSGVNASRSGDKVTISWQAAPSAPELEYLVEAIICTSGGYLLEVAYSTTNTSLQITDTKQCGNPSFGTLRVANKLGYSSATQIPWP